MILSKEFYDRCSPSYKTVIKELEKKLSDINKSNDEKTMNAEKIQSAIMDFSKEYLTPKEYWKYCYRTVSSLGDNRWKISKNAYYHLFITRDFMNYLYEYPYGYFYSDDYINGRKHFKLHNFQMKEELEFDFGEHYVVNERDLVYPHDSLEECLRHFEGQANCLSSSKLLKRYEEMKELYLKIETAESDVEKWLQVLTEVNDDTFVMDNVEYRLGQDLLDAKLWKLYIQFLEEHGKYKQLLETYSKYCRFFLDDKEMKDRYEEAIIIYGPINLPWDNFYEFEGENNVKEVCNNEKASDNKEAAADCDMESVTEDEKMEEENEDQTVENAQVPELDKKLCSAFYDIYQTQNFAFLDPIIRYILENANHRTLRKLFSTCKYFFAKQPTPICYRLENSYREMYVKESLCLEYSSNQNLLIKNAFITGCIDVKRRRGYAVYQNHDFTFMSKLIPRLFRCDAKYIYIGDQKLSFNELEFLIGHGKVVDLDIEHSDIRNENNGFVKLEKVMALLPNIKWLRLPDIKTTTNSGLELTKLNFNAKIVEFDIHKIHGEPLNVHEFLKFIIANRNEKHFTCYLGFYKEHFNADFIDKFGKVMKDYKKSCENTHINIYVDYD